MKRLHWVLLGMLLPGLALAVEKGSTLEPWTLQDQFEKAHSLDDSTRVLLVARDMDGSKLVKAALAERPKGYLEARHALFLADISRMPALISRLFAVPAMRDYSYPVLLDRDAAIASRYASDEGKVLWVRLEQRRVELNRAERDAGDLASELQFLAENLDDQRDYAFMRP